ncbi:MAG TPA: SprT-like domain-containing protein [Pseudolabrys sp.]
MAEFTLLDMEHFATEAWGPLGTSTIKKWAEFNRLYFEDSLRPVPIVMTHAQPFGKRLAFCSYNPDTHGRTITLNVPKKHNTLLADNAVLLHEMIHQYLFERGEEASHAGDGWRREIMRINWLIAGKEIWAGRSTTARRKVDGVVVRMNVPHPDTGKKSLGQSDIALWPHNRRGIRLGKLGAPGSGSRDRGVPVGPIAQS